MCDFLCKYLSVSVWVSVSFGHVAQFMIITCFALHFFSSSVMRTVFIYLSMSVSRYWEIQFSFSLLLPFSLPLSFFSPFKRDTEVHMNSPWLHFLSLARPNVRTFSQTSENSFRRLLPPPSSVGIDPEAECSLKKDMLAIIYKTFILQQVDKVRIRNQDKRHIPEYKQLHKQASKHKLFFVEIESQEKHANKRTSLNLSKVRNKRRHTWISKQTTPRKAKQESTQSYKQTNNHRAQSRKHDRKSSRFAVHLRETCLHYLSVRRRRQGLGKRERRKRNRFEAWNVSRACHC